jgi:ABC-type multidrug transport system fused ATPase/permease subunit
MLNVRLTNRQLLKDMWRFLKPYWRPFLMGSFLRVTSDVVWLFPPLAMSWIVTMATEYQVGDSLTFFWQLMTAVWVVAVYHHVGHDVAKYLVYPVAERMSLDAFLLSTRQLFQLDSAWHERENSGNKIQRIRKGAESLNELMRLYVDLFIESTVNIIGVTLVLLTMGPTVDIVLITFFVTYFILSYFLTRKAVGQSYKANVRWEEFNGVLYESINNMATIKALGIWRSILRLLTESTHRLMADIKKRVFWFRTRGATLNLYRELFRQALLLYIVLQVF